MPKVAAGSGTREAAAPESSSVPAEDAVPSPAAGKKRKIGGPELIKEPALADESQATSDDGWQQRLEDLKRRRPARIRPIATAPSEDSKMGSEEILDLIRVACETDKEADWQKLTFPAATQLNGDALRQAMAQLRGDQPLKLLQACTSRHLENPQERGICTQLILKVFEEKAGVLLGRKEVQAAMRPLLKFLERDIGSYWQQQESLECIGKWKLVSALNVARRKSAQEGPSDTTRSRKKGSRGDLKGSASAAHASAPVLANEDDVAGTGADADVESAGDAGDEDTGEASGEEDGAADEVDEDGDSN